jgi:effector-binding domain-containing protein
VEIVRPARVEERPERPYVGIRVVTPFRGMLGVYADLLKELSAWVAQSGLETVEYGFLRLHVIDMSGPMDVEAGFFTVGEQPGDDRVRPGLMPPGRYATLTYRDHAIQANRALIDWVRDSGLTLDRRGEPEGDAFACRYEACLTDPKLEPRKTRREIELAIKLV